MPPRIKPLDELAAEDHGKFQEHFLKAEAMMMPWHTRPQLSTSPYTLSDFHEHFRVKMLAALNPPDRICMQTQDYSLKRPVVLHLVHNSLVFCTSRLAAGMNDTEMLDQWALQGKLIDHNGNFKMVDSSHPLFGHYKTKPVDSFVCKMDVTAVDRQFAKWFAGQPMQKLADAVPEYTKLSPDTRLASYSLGLRKKLKSVLANALMLNPELSTEAVNSLLEEWLALREAQPDFEEKVQAVLREFDLLEFEANSTELVKRVRHPHTLRTADEEAKFAPLYEKLTMQAAADGYNMTVHEFLRDWSFAVARLGVAACERPAMGMAMLATMLRCPDTDPQDVLKKF